MQFSTFSFAQQYNIRAFEKDGIAWFVAADICHALELTNSRMALAALDEDEKTDAEIQTTGGKQTVNIINESGLFILILRSRKAMEKGTPQHAFRKWVTAEVLPAIRKTGSYSNPAANRPLNEWEQHQIQVAVKQRSSRTGETTQAVYAKLHSYMECTSYLHICQADFQAALNFLASIQDAPELFRQPEIQGIVFTEAEVYNFTVVTRYAQNMSLFFHHLESPLRQLGSTYLKQVEAWADEPHSWICDSQRSLMAVFKQMKNPKYINGVQSNFAKMM